MALPPLITEEGLVLNNMMPGEGALGGYTPKGTASSEGISLMLRGMVRAAIATGDSAKTAFAKFLFDSACEHFFRGVRPTNQAGQGWHHSWICNGGEAFNVRGPIQASGDLALSGYLYGRDPEASITFVAGVGQLTPAPDIVYQAVSSDAAFVWNNVFAEMTKGTSYEVEYYIDAKGNRIAGAQKTGSFGQPAIPAGQHNDGLPGKVKLKQSITGTVGVCYCDTVPGVTVAYGELYEAWPMWRKLADNEVSTAGDAIHWFLDAFALGKQLEPSNADWRNAYDRMLEVWQLTCTQESNNTRIFQTGANGPHNNYPLTYSYGYGRTNIDDPTTNWDAVAPSDKYSASRTSDGYVTFVLPEEYAEKDSGQSIRYGVAFENKPLYLNYTGTSTLSVDSKSSVEQTITATITGTNGQSYDASVLIGPNTAAQTLQLGQFVQFQQQAGEATGDKTGDWTDVPDEDEFVMPVYNAVPFPGRRLMLVGDSITWYNSYYFPPVVEENNRLAYYSFGMCGYWTYADQLLSGRLELEHGIQPDLGGQGNGYNVAVAGSRVAQWWEEKINPIGTEAAGPMYAALNNLTKFDVVVMMGGTNDLAGNLPTKEVLTNLKRATTDLAKNGKWVFLMAIPPRSRGELTGYSVEQQNTIRTRLQQVNQGIRDWMATTQPKNIFFVDHWADMVGPNGIDPAGTLSVPGGEDVRGNYRPEANNIIFLHDGLHPASAGAYVMGKKLAAAITAAGVPARTSETTLGPLSLGPNLLPNTNFAFTQWPLESQYDQQGNPISWGFTRAGWATGLGSHLTVGSAPPLHNGYTHGKLPDHWHFYRCSNATDQVIGNSEGGSFSNFMDYTFKDLVNTYPEVAEYMSDSTWPDGAAKVSLITDGGVPAIKIDIDFPQTGNKNEGFVLMAHVPQDQHGPWDNYGYITPDKGPVRANSVYDAGDRIQSESTIVFSRLNGTLHSYRQTVNFLGVDTTDQSDSTNSAKMSGIGNSHNFWPPSDLDKVRIHPENKTLRFRSPVVTVPAYASNENRRYAQFKLEFSFDASTGPVTATIIVKNPSVRKVTGGTPL